MLGDRTVQQLGDNILDFLVPYVGAQAGVLFKSQGKQFERVAQLGVPADAAVATQFTLREGLLGRVAADGRPVAGPGDQRPGPERGTPVRRGTGRAAGPAPPPAIPGPNYGNRAGHMIE